MKKQVNFLDYLQKSGEIVRDWPSWKKDIWPESKVDSSAEITRSPEHLAAQQGRSFMVGPFAHHSK